MEQIRNCSIPRRWWRSRKLVYLGLLLIGAVVSAWLLDWLLMPDDLRRLQGAWKTVRTITRGKEELAPFDRLVFSGRRVTIVKNAGAIQNSFALEIHSDRRELVVYDEQKLTFLGMTFRLPLWLTRTPGAAEFAHYELTDKLVLRTPAEESDEGGAPGCDIFLEREG